MSEFLEIIEKNTRDKKLFSKVKSLQNLNIRFTFQQKEEKKLKKSTKLNNTIPFLDREKSKMKKEIEKFFIFLNSLSAYQIKLLNDTQPTNDARNDLPIFFNNQFKDTLSAAQKENFEKLNIMSLGRCAILNVPNNYILPSNLKFSSLNQRKNNITENNNNINNNNFQISFNGSLMNIDNNENNEEEEENDNFNLNEKEIEIFKKMISSKNCKKIRRK